MRTLFSVAALLAAFATVPAWAADPDPHAGHHPPAATTNAPAAQEPDAKGAGQCPMTPAGQMGPSGADAHQGMGSMGGMGSMSGMAAGGMAAGGMMQEGHVMHCMAKPVETPAAKAGEHDHALPKGAD